ncbi:MAG: hypothetical protein C7B45_00900 [Sulfobacillus acidophilus]|uniref:Uncharacterized protein n=1 Tax=Sulfobacillus acidophilus TaxID=53633 RepID=A0A2T2WNS1_9FIRM|nr:MAG: hypothetical protein C7B45_00900 [Sulfobacillus acidophilus]
MNRLLEATTLGRCLGQVSKGIPALETPGTLGFVHTLTNHRRYHIADGPGGMRRLAPAAGSGPETKRALGQHLLRQAVDCEYG